MSGHRPDMSGHESSGWGMVKTIAWEEWSEVRGMQ